VAVLQCLTVFVFYNSYYKIPLFIYIKTLFKQITGVLLQHFVKGHITYWFSQKRVNNQQNTTAHIPKYKNKRKGIKYINIKIFLENKAIPMQQ